jgi:hypothetical protein
MKVAHSELYFSDEEEE